MAIPYWDIALGIICCANIVFILIIWLIVYKKTVPANRDKDFEEIIAKVNSKGSKK